MVATTLNPARSRRDYVFAWLAGACALVAFGGFAGTYWLQLPGGTFRGAPILHLHALLFSAWSLLFVSQAVLVARGRLSHHRAWGVAGVSLATAMVLTGLAVAAGAIAHGDAQGWGAQARAFSIVPVSTIALFAVYFIAAVLNVSRPDWHKRLMLAATVAIIGAAVARITFLLAVGGGPGVRPGLGPPPPISLATIDALVAGLILVAGIVYDWRTRGRPHGAYIIGLGGLLLVSVIRIPLSSTREWLAVADGLARFGG